MNIEIGKNNFSELSECLRENGVDESDISLLQGAIREDGELIQLNGFGDEVSGWIGSMVSKSATGGWNVSIAAAGNLLATTIGKYYGIS